MKSIFLSLLALSTPAFASPIVCQSQNASAEFNIYAVFNSERSEVQVGQSSTEESKVLARLECRKAIRRGGNLSAPLIMCREPSFKETGYSLLLKRKSTDAFVAFLHEVNNSSARRIDILNCVALQN